MDWKDWLLGGGFLVVLAAVAVTVVLVLAHERGQVVHSVRHQGINLHYCYQNLGNGGC